MKAALPIIYSVEELNQAIEGLEHLINMCERGDIDQHLSPALLIAYDCVSHEIETRKKPSHPYYWRVKTRLPERKGQPCRVLVRAKMNSCLVEFQDGYKVVTSRNYIRKRKGT